MMNTEGNNSLFLVPSILNAFPFHSQCGETRWTYILASVLTFCARGSEEKKGLKEKIEGMKDCSRTE